MSHPGSRLRALLAAPGTVMAPGAFNAMSAKLAQESGFQALYVPGGGTALAQYGVADLGLLTLNEMVANAGAIAQAVTLPVIADADTGFGNALNVQRTVRDYERAGLAAIHIEDQEFPKRCGFFEGKKLIPLPEAANKIRAAVAARQHPDFMIIARCDAMSVGGMAEVKARAAAYLAAGADMLFIEGGTGGDEMRNLPREVPGVHVFNMSASGKMPLLSAQEVGDLGYKLMIFPNFATLSALQAIRETYRRIAQDQSIENLGPLCASFADFTALGGMAEFRHLERTFGV